MLLVDDDAPRGQWKLGRVEEVRVDDQSVVRSVKVKLQTGSLERPVSKLVLLLEAENLG